MVGLYLILQEMVIMIFSNLDDSMILWKLKIDDIRISSCVKLANVKVGFVELPTHRLYSLGYT